MLSRMLMIDDAFEEFRGPLLYRQGMKKVVCFFGEEDIRSLQLTRVSILTLFSMSGLDSENFNKLQLLVELGWFNGFC